jgi:hypothetical protein
VEVPRAQPADGGDRLGFGGISCQVACIAVGIVGTSESWWGPSVARDAVVYTEQTDRSWSTDLVPLPLPARWNQIPSISAVSCTALTGSLAVGWYVNVLTEREFPFVIEQAAGTWSAFRLPLPGVADLTALPPATSVSCLGNGTCVVISSYDNYKGSYTLLVVLSGNKATDEHVLLPPNASNSPRIFLMGLSCADTYCVIVGSYLNTAGIFEGFVDTFSGTSWSSQQSPAPADASQTVGINLFTVACDSAGSCAAGGADEVGTVGSQFILTSSDGSHWAAYDAPTPGSGPNRSPTPLLSACAAAGCAMAGQYGAAAQYTDLLAPIDAGAQAIRPRSPDSGTVQVASIACANSGVCAAVGTLPTNNRNIPQEGLLITGTTNGGWRSATAPLPSDAASNQDATLVSAACDAAGNCYAVGSYIGAAGTEAIMESYQP